MSARWIWALNLQDTDEAYCRCTEGHPHAGLTVDGQGQFHIRVDDTSTLYVSSLCNAHDLPWGRSDGLWVSFIVLIHSVFLRIRHR